MGRHISSDIISIHALREEGDSGLFMEAVRIIKISIHALREEGDQHCYPDYDLADISIHALREEGDSRHLR